MTSNRKRLKILRDLQERFCTDQEKFLQETVTEQILMAAFELDEDTIREWESRGLKVHNPGEPEKLFLNADVKEFLEREARKANERAENGENPEKEETTP